VIIAVRVGVNSVERADIATLGICTTGEMIRGALRGILWRSLGWVPLGFVCGWLALRDLTNIVVVVATSASEASVAIGRGERGVGVFVRRRILVRGRIAVGFEGGAAR
jgi:hypothetical protein